MPTSEAEAGECPFCEIVTKEDRDVREIYRDERLIVFFPLEPATLGHTLIVPKKHVPDIWALDRDLAAYLGPAVVAVAHAVKRAMRPDGLNVIQSNGEAATQTVHHFHIHIVPRWHGDAIGRIWPPETKFSEDQKDFAWEAIRAECQRITI